MSNKKDKIQSFVLYNDVIDTARDLDDYEDLGKLFEMILLQANGEEVECDDKLLRIAFGPISRAMKRDREKYESKIDEDSDNGSEGNLKRWYPDISKEFKAGKITIEEAWEKAKEVKKQRKSSPPDSPRSDGIGNIAYPYPSPLPSPDSFSNPSPDSEPEEKQKKKKELSEKGFLKMWNTSRKEELGVKESNVSNIYTNVKHEFRELVKKHDVKDFQKALKGFWMQKGLWPAVKTEPTHFIGKFEVYLDAFENNLQIYEDKKNKQPQKVY